MLRGVGDVEVVPGAPPTLRYELDELVTTVSAGLVVGADGRTSSVRRQLGLALHQTAPRTMAGGMLVDGLDGWPADQMSLGTEGDLYYLVFPRAHGRARLYLLHDLAQRGRFAGPDRQARFLDAFRFRCLPDAEVFRAARPAGPCAFYPMNDTWIDGPCAPVSCSSATRPAGTTRSSVRACRSRCGTYGWWPTSSAPARIARSPPSRPTSRSGGNGCGGCGSRRRSQTALVATFTPAGAARRKAFNAVFRTDPVLGGSRLAAQLGPENVPAEAFDPETVARILAMG